MWDNLVLSAELKYKLATVGSFYGRPFQLLRPLLK